MRFTSSNRYIPKTLNRILKILRISAELTQDQISQKLNLSWQDIESGKTQVTYEMPLVVADWVDIPVWSMIYIAEFYDRSEADLYLDPSELPRLAGGLIDLLQLPSLMTEADQDK